MQLALRISQISTMKAVIQNVSLLLLIASVTSKIATAAGTAPRIAVIGAGVGGTGVSYFLSQLTNNNIHIEIFEKSNLIGGRLHTVDILGNHYETGGSIIHPKNKLARDLVKKLGLREKTDIGGFGFSIMKGEEVAFSASKWSLITLYRLLYHYGFQLQHLQKLTTGFINEFSTVYDLQENGKAFKTPEELLEAMSPALLNLTKSDFRTYLLDLGYKTNFVDELVQAITYVNYGQDTSINSFVGSVSVAGADDDLWSVQQGNWHLANALYNNSVAKLHLKSPVTSIIQNEDGTFGITVDSKPYSQTFDQVIIGNPLEVNRIKFENFKTEPYNYGNRRYHRTVATFVAGHLTDKYLHLVDIMTCTPDSFYTTLTRVFPTKLEQSEKFPVYKIFSQVPVTNEQLKNTFQDVKVLNEFDWQAYPHYDQIPPSMPTFVLQPRLYYINAIEWAASAIEMSLISAKNIALLIAQEANIQVGSKSSESQKTEL